MTCWGDSSTLIHWLTLDTLTSRGAPRSVRLSSCPWPVYLRSPNQATMPQDQRTELNRKRKAAKKLAEWKEAAANAPAGKRPAKKAAKKG